NEKEFNLKHILDSIEIIKHYDLKNKSIIDVGSGGGFPGLVLAIVLDKSKLILIDSNKKKIDYINFVVKELGLNNVKTINNRVEEINFKADVVVSRAVAPLNILLEITHHLVNKKGYLIFYKGSNVKKELPINMIKIENELSIKFIENKEYILDDMVKRSFICFEKNIIIKKREVRTFSQIKTIPLY
ncbi:MAG: 16S rRNA (guanine(527)-N(7))-methyltransferase RsmG, partial [Mycoplasmataceae bacterium]|nr:16S rRNA (guanine(527)-N(7))-methyltransferase RsmG [Mycoplasmataceae bacterium]